MYAKEGAGLDLKKNFLPDGRKFKKKNRKIDQKARTGRT